MKLVAEPVEGRIRVALNGHEALLVPAVRHPELAEGVKTYPVNEWARQLAKAAAALPTEQLNEYLSRALAKGDALVGSGANALQVAFSGFSIAEFDRLALAGLPASGITNPLSSRSLEELFLSAPIVAVAEMEGIEPADRDDGLALDYRYRVVESWRGGQRVGDLLIVRMPPLLDKSRSRLITPERGARVLLQASRPGYVAATLRNGKAPSADMRVVAMTLPLLRVFDDRLTEAIKGADVLGSARFQGMKLEQARSRALALEAKAQAALSVGTLPQRHRFFVSRIGQRTLADPIRYWIEYDPNVATGDRRGLGGVVAWFDGCLVRKAAGLAPAINTCQGNRRTEREPAVQRAVRWNDGYNLPEVPGAHDAHTAILVPTEPPLTLRGAIR